MDGTAKSKPAGHDKIRFCGDQAKRDKLQYFWIDTCCIDKVQSAQGHSHRRICNFTSGRGDP
ncbi:hypothetical protein V8E54_011162 [Elaphomyces granulatus]